MPIFGIQGSGCDVFLSRHPRPTLLLWGERDGLNPPATVGQKARQTTAVLLGFENDTNSIHRIDT